MIRSSNNHIFGVFTSIPFETPLDGGIYTKDEHSFIFRLCPGISKHKVHQNQDYAVGFSKSCFIVCGYGGFDLRVVDNCNMNENSRSNMGQTFEAPY